MKNINFEQLDKRKVELQNGLFFWLGFINNNMIYKPFFNKNLFDKPEITGETTKNENSRSIYYREDKK